MAPATNCEICADPAGKQCGSCQTATYCCQEHQKLAWPKHKRLCKILRAIENGEQAPPRDSYCNLCGKTAEDGPLTNVECSGRTLCDDASSYKLLSYARNSCWRNHTRYTNCAQHWSEYHAEKLRDELEHHLRGHVGPADVHLKAAQSKEITLRPPNDVKSHTYLSCPICLDANIAEDTAWYRTNNYNFHPKMDQKHVPKFEFQKCTSCGREIRRNCDGVTTGKLGKPYCNPCVGGQPGMFGVLPGAPGLMSQLP